MGKIRFYELWDRKESETQQNLNADDSAIFNKRMEYANKKVLGMFTEIGIETISRCNSKCSFCPVSIQNEKRPLTVMSDDVWQSIINQLKDLNFSGTIYPYINNEIFLDKKIFDRLEYARLKLGESIKINIETNGILLKQRNDKGIKLIEKASHYVDQIFINDYADTDENYKNFNPRIRYIIDNLEKINVKRDLELKVCHRQLTQLLNNRFGMVDGHLKQTVPEKELFCDFPFFQFNVNPNGDAFICCRDSYYLETIGNITEQTRKDIWFGSRYKEIRNAFINNKRICDVCKVCTSSGTLTM